MSIQSIWQQLAPHWFFISVILLGAVLVIAVAFALLSRFERAMTSDSRSIWARLATSFLRKLVVALVVLVAVMLVLRRIGLDASDLMPPNAGPLPSALRIAFAIGAAYVVTKIIHLGIGRLEGAVETEISIAPSERQKRVRTMAGMLRKLTAAVVAIITGMIVLRELGVDITPIITGAGIIGIALGFGAQSLIRDVISGFFLILEDQVRIGDVAVVNGTTGVVEELNLRTIVLRDMEGTVHIFPNGRIDTLANRTKGWSGYVIDVGVAYKADIDQVMQVLKEVGDELKADPVFGPLMLESLEVLGVDDFGPSQVTIKIRLKTVPLKQADVGRELRRRIKNTFDAKGIEIPYPHTSLYFGEASKPFVVELRTKQADQPATDH
jgi:small conductance mechanosensitive channel